MISTQPITSLVGQDWQTPYMMRIAMLDGVLSVVHFRTKKNASRCYAFLSQTERMLDAFTIASTPYRFLSFLGEYSPLFGGFSKQLTVEDCFALKECDPRVLVQIFNEYDIHLSKRGGQSLIKEFGFIKENLPAYLSDFTELISDRRLLLPTTEILAYSLKDALLARTIVLLVLRLFATHKQGELSEQVLGELGFSREIDFSEYYYHIRPDYAYLDFLAAFARDARQKTELVGPAFMPDKAVSFLFPSVRKDINEDSLLFVAGMINVHRRGLEYRALVSETKILEAPYSDILLSTLWNQIIWRCNDSRIGICEICEKPYITKGERGKPRKYCSPKCNKAAQRKRKRLENINKMQFSEHY